MLAIIYWLTQHPDTKLNSTWLIGWWTILIFLLVVPIAAAAFLVFGWAKLTPRQRINLFSVLLIF